MGETVRMKMAKADPDDLDRMLNFFNMLEEAIEYGTITHDCGGPNERTERIDDERLVELIRQHWGKYGPGVGPAWRRVIGGCQILIDNCCDPALSYLEWRPDIKAFLESQPSE